MSLYLAYPVSAFRRLHFPRENFAELGIISDSGHQGRLDSEGLPLDDRVRLQAERRLWHFCSCVGLDKRDVLNQPELFADRKLRLEIHTVAPEQSSQDHPYSDVRLFLPAESRAVATPPL